MFENRQLLDPTEWSNTTSVDLCTFKEEKQIKLSLERSWTETLLQRRKGGGVGVRFLIQSCGKVLFCSCAECVWGQILFSRALAACRGSRNDRSKPLTGTSAGAGRQ